MLHSRQPSSSTQNSPQPPRLYSDGTVRTQRPTSSSKGQLRPISPRRRAMTDINGSRTQLGSRSKSESNMSLFSSWEKLPSPSSDASPPPSSRTTRSSGASLYREDRPESMAATFFTKSSKLLTKRRKVKVDISPVRTAEWMVDIDAANSKDVQELSKRRKSKHSRAQSIGYEYMLKKSISDPYNFQHLTHTATHQAKALQCASEHELVTEFSAIRASQAPRAGLKGIKAEPLHRTNRSVGTGSPASSLASPSMSTISPVTSRDEWTDSTAGSIRYSRSVDSFTRLSARSFSSPTPPISPPARRSSRMFMMLPPQQVPKRESPAAPYFDFGTSVEKDASSPRNPNPEHTKTTKDNDYAYDASGIAQAVTTPDDTAYTLGMHQRLSPSAVLDDVPEEDEAFPWGRQSGSHLRPPPIAHSKSFPSLDRFNPSPLDSSERMKQKLHTMLVDEWGAASDPTLPCQNGQKEEIPEHARLSRRISMTVKGLAESWEDDIDYCYEHAAEANSAFDWYSVPEENDMRLVACDREALADNASGFSHFLDVPSGRTTAMTNRRAETPQRPSSRSSSCYSTDLNSLHITTSTFVSTPVSAVSSAVTVPGVVTPVEPIQSYQAISVVGALSDEISSISPSVLGPQEYAQCVPYEDTFHHQLADADNTKTKCPPFSQVLECVVPTIDSIRDSSSSMGKRDSRDSSIVPSRPTSAGARHGNGSSIGSLPELVHSKASRDRTAHAAGSLVDHITALNLTENREELSLIIEAARQNFLRKATDTNSIDEESNVLAPLTLPSVYARHRSNSDSANVLLNPSATKGAGRVTAERMRPSSHATAPLYRTKTNRASYSLFPARTAR